jgi:hypothetical protein
LEDSRCDWTLREEEIHEKSPRRWDCANNYELVSPCLQMGAVDIADSVCKQIPERVCQAQERRPVSDTNGLFIGFIPHRRQEKVASVEQDSSIPRMNRNPASAEKLLQPPRAINISPQINTLAASHLETKSSAWQNLLRIRTISYSQSLWERLGFLATYEHVPEVKY